MSTELLPYEGSMDDRMIMLGHVSPSRDLRLRFRQWLPQTFSKQLIFSAVVIALELFLYAVSSYVKQVNHWR
jgi:hypothetical protein